MAKGVEDTAFYRWSRLVALNEVGGDPDRFGVTPGGVPRLHAGASGPALAGHHDHAVHPRHQARRRTCSARLAVLAESAAGVAVTRSSRWHDRAGWLADGGRAPSLSEPQST